MDLPCNIAYYTEVIVTCNPQQAIMIIRTFAFYFPYLIRISKIPFRIDGHPRTATITEGPFEKLTRESRIALRLPIHIGLRKPSQRVAQASMRLGQPSMEPAQPFMGFAQPSLRAAPSYRNIPQAISPSPSPRCDDVSNSRVLSGRARCTSPTPRSCEMRSRSRSRSRSQSRPGSDCSPRPLVASCIPRPVRTAISPRRADDAKPPWKY